MKKEDAKKLKSGDMIITVGLREPILCIVDTVSEYGGVNVHDIHNEGSFFRAYDEIFRPIKNCDSISAMYYMQKYEQIGQMYEEFRNNSLLWFENDKPFGKQILALLDADFCGGTSRYALLTRCEKPYEHYAEEGEEVPESAITKFLVLK